MPPKLDIRIVRFEEWPQSDRIAWQSADRPRSRLNSHVGLSRYSSKRRSALRRAYGRWLGFLAQRLGVTGIATGLDHLDDANLQAFLDHMYARVSSCTVRGYVTDLETVVRAMAPGRSFDSLRQATRHTWRTASPERDKTHLVVPARDLAALGRSLMDAAALRRSDLGKARAYRDGLTIALLIAAPVRIGNFASIEIGRHLLKLDHTYRLVFPGPEMKNRRPMECYLSRELGAAIDTYIEQHRPRLLAQRGPEPAAEADTALWISDHGVALVAKQMSHRICERTRKRFGHTVNPHLFRDCAATSIAVEDPQHVGIIPVILGHARPETGERSYNQAGGLEAGRRHQAVLEHLRR